MIREFFMHLYANIKVQFQRRDKIGRNIQRQAFRNEIIASLFLFVRNEQRSLSKYQTRYKSIQES